MQAEKQVAAIPRDGAQVGLFSSSLQRVHVVGVAGSGLRGIVYLLHERGVKVTGSELAENPVLDKFRLAGITCRVGHCSENIEADTSLVLKSAAVADSNPEVLAARERRIPVLKYAEFLGLLMSEKTGIAVSGTHGKTTTTAMASWVLSEAGLDPTFVVGGEYPGLGGSSRWGKGMHFVAEACEYDRSFLKLRPKISIVTNIEEDHLDYFESLKEIQGAFAQFVSLLPEDGYLVVNRDDANSNYLSEFCRSSVGTFSLRRKAADWWAEDISSSDGGGTRFRIVSSRGENSPARLRIPGIHNVYNTLAATAVCHRVGVPVATTAQILESFTGVRRRFDVLYRGDVLVVDDYAHHPTEIHAVLQAARQSLPDRRLIAVFQPHQHSRLKKFRRQFANVLSCFDMALVLDVYQARDKDEDIQTVQSDSLVAVMRDMRPDARTLYTPAFEDVLRALRRNVQDKDVVIFMGAGSVTDLAKRYAYELSSQ